MSDQLFRADKAHSRDYTVFSYSSQSNNSDVSTRRQHNLILAHKLIRIWLHIVPIRWKWTGTEWIRKPPFRWKKQNLATTDQDQVERWWAKYPDATPGIYEPSLILIDADRHVGQADGVEALHNLLPPITTPVAHTPQHGEHWLFRKPDGVVLGNLRGSLPAGIHVVGKNWIVAPGSVRPDGVMYRVDETMPDIEEGIAELPTVLLELIQTSRTNRDAGDGGGGGLSLRIHDPKSYVRSRVEGITRRMSRKVLGERNNTLFWGASRLGELLGDHLGEAAAERALQQAAKDCGLDDEEIAGTLWSGITAGKNNPISLEYDEVSSWPHLSISPITAEDIKDAARLSFTQLVEELWTASEDYVVVKPPGLGATTVHFRAMARKMQTAKSFLVCACRKREQAEAKAEEFRQLTGKQAIVIRSFREYYVMACQAVGVEALDDFDFQDGSLCGMLAKIQQEQPAVFARLMEIQTATWNGKIFDPRQTAIFMTHKMRMGWQWSRASRLFNHPRFVYPEDDQNLRNELGIEDTVWDEQEPDELLTIIPEKLFRFLKGKRIAKHREEWNSLTKRNKIEVYNKVRCNTHLLNGIGFLKFDELIRIEPSLFRGYTVKFDFDPYGQQRNEKNCYRRRKTKLFIAIKPWISVDHGRIAFLTTEKLVSEVIAAAFQAKERPLTRTTVPSPFCIPVPVQFDYRANKTHIQALTGELQGAGNEVVIADMTKGLATTIQGMKGDNGMADRDVTIILTHLSPQHYEKLNVIGQLIGKPTVAMFYEDIILQGIGRNSGFRGNGRRVRIICTRQLWDSTLSKLKSDAFSLYISDPAIQEILGDRTDTSVPELLTEMYLDPSQLNRERIANYLIATGFLHYRYRKGNSWEWRYRKGTYQGERVKTTNTTESIDLENLFRENPKYHSEINAVPPLNIIGIGDGTITVTELVTATDTIDHSPSYSPAPLDTCPKVTALGSYEMLNQDEAKTYRRYCDKDEPPLNCYPRRPDYFRCIPPPLQPSDEDIDAIVDQVLAETEDDRVVDVPFPFPNKSCHTGINEAINDNDLTDDECIRILVGEQP